MVTRATVVAALALVSACAEAKDRDLPAVVGALGTSSAPAGFWDHWGDGRAEIDGYRVTVSRYGELRRGEAVLIFVTETFTHAQRVKSDGGHPDEYPVLKLNTVLDFQTGIYDYDTMTSTFLRLDGGAPLGVPTKIALSAQEWCGSFYQHVHAEPGELRFTTHSYFDGEADAEVTLPLPVDAIAADALPMLVRGLTGPLVAPGTSVKVQLLPTLLDARLLHVDNTFVAATISAAADTAPVTVPHGTFEARAYRIEAADGAWTEYQVEVAEPRRIVAWSRSDGQRAELVGTVREPYWTLNGEGDERIRAQLGLPVTTWP